MRPSLLSKLALVGITSIAFMTAPLPAQGNQTFGQGAPATLVELPTGPFRSALEALSAASRNRALAILQSFDFNEQDLPFLRVDSGGGVFYEDPMIDGDQAEEAGETASLPEEITIGEAFTLHSKAGASRTVYLDMDGHVVTGTIWNNVADPLYMRPYDTDGDEAVFTQSELNDIAETWKRLAEDFAPYDIDVTTEAPPSFGPNVGHILVTRKADENGNLIFSCSCGGVAYVGVWGRSNYPYYQPALVFLDGVGGPHNISEAASHELGHNLNLSHDGAPGTGYYSGHGSGYTDWGPIMGVGYYAQVTQWSKGEYQGANNTQDDLEIIRGYLNYRIDDHEDVDFAWATPLTITNGTDVYATNPVTDPGNTDQTNKGIIEDRSDLDLFYFDVGAGLVDLTVTPTWIDAFTSQSRRGMNLDVEATLYDEFGNQIAQSNPTSDTYSQISVSVGVGRYVLAIDGLGTGDPLTDGYSDYASIGQYFINGTVPEDIVSSAPPLAPSDLDSLSGEVDVLLTWTDPDSTPESNEAGYRVSRAVDGGPFVQIATLPRDSQSYADNNLQTGSYRYQVEVYNSAGTDTSNTTEPIQIWAPWVAYASSETSIDGTIQSGSYFDTATSNSSETLIEEHQGGRKSLRVSKLEHLWTVTGVVAGAQVTLEVEAEAPANNEGDDFQFTHDAANADPNSPVAQVLDNGTGGPQTLSWSLAAQTSGTVEVRVIDTNRDVGSGQTNTVEIHRIEIRSSGDPGDQTPVVAITDPADGFSAEQGTAILFSATADDLEDGDLSGSIGWSSDIDGSIGNGASISVDTLSLGSHIISAQVADSASNTGSHSITVDIQAPDTTPPTITAPADVTVEATAPLTPVNPGTPTVSDDTDLSPTVSVDNNGPFPVGSTVVTWTATDGSGNSASATQTVTVTDTTAPVITVLGSDPATVDVGSVYSDAGATATDIVDGDLTPSITSTGLPIDTSQPGSFLVTYSVSDTAGNNAQATRTVNVIDAGNPLTVTSVSPNPVTVAQLKSGLSLTISGSGFEAGASVTFLNGSGPAPSAANIVLIDSNTLTADVTGKSGGPPQPRFWDVRVTNPSGVSSVCSACLELNP